MISHHESLSVRGWTMDMERHCRDMTMGNTVAGGGRDLRILIVDSYGDTTNFVLDRMERNGFRISYECIDSAHELRERLRRKSWDMVVCDSYMPAGEIIRIVRERDERLPILFVPGAMAGGYMDAVIGFSQDAMAPLWPRHDA